jgi:hypothetical protein
MILRINNFVKTYYKLRPFSIFFIGAEITSPQDRYNRQFGETSTNPHIRHCIKGLLKSWKYHEYVWQTSTGCDKSQFGRHFSARVIHPTGGLIRWV